MIGVFLCGEGANELGSRAGHPAYHADERGHVEPGVLEALLRRAKSEGWEVRGACKWSALSKFRAGAEAKGLSGDARSVVIAALHAEESGAGVLAFTRDEDGVLEREAAVEAGRREASGKFPEIRIIGGLAVRSIDAWVLAVGGIAKTEALSRQRAKEQLHATASTTKDKVDIIHDADLSALPEDAASLRAWLASADAVLGSK